MLLHSGRVHSGSAAGPLEFPLKVPAEWAAHKRLSLTFRSSPPGVAAGNAGFPAATRPALPPGARLAWNVCSMRHSRPVRISCGKEDGVVSQAFPAPTFGHAAEAFVVGHAAPGAWSAGTAVKYRQTLAALGGRLAEIAPAAAADVAVLGTPPGASALEAAFTAAFGGLAPRRAHGTCPRCALRWPGGQRPAGWPPTRPPGGRGRRSPWTPPGR